MVFVKGHYMNKLSIFDRYDRMNHTDGETNQILYIMIISDQ